MRILNHITHIFVDQVLRLGMKVFVFEILSCVHIYLLVYLIIGNTTKRVYSTKHGVF